MLKLIVKTLEEVPEALRGEYKKVGEEYHLDTDDKSRTDEFRETNRAQARKIQQLEDQAKKYAGIDPDKHAEAMQALQLLEADEEGKLIKAGKLDEVVSRRVKANAKQYEEQLAALKGQLETANKNATAYKTRLSSLTLNEQITKVVGSVGEIKKGALEDILLRAQTVFTLDEAGEQLVPVGPSGKKTFGSDGVNPITVEEWAKGLVKSASYLFEPSKGGGGTGGNGSDGGKSGAKGETFIDRNDPVAMGRNLEGIVKGTVKPIDRNA